MHWGTRKQWIYFTCLFVLETKKAQDIWFTPLINSFKKQRNHWKRELKYCTYCLLTFFANETILTKWNRRSNSARRVLALHLRFTRLPSFLHRIEQLHTGFLRHMLPIRNVLRHFRDNCVVRRERLPLIRFQIAHRMNSRKRMNECHDRVKVVVVVAIRICDVAVAQRREIIRFQQQMLEILVLHSRKSR